MEKGGGSIDYGHRANVRMWLLIQRKLRQHRDPGAFNRIWHVLFRGSGQADGAQSSLLCLLSCMIPRFRPRASFTAGRFCLAWSPWQTAKGAVLTSISFPIGLRKPGKQRARASSANHLLHQPRKNNERDSCLSSCTCRCPIARAGLCFMLESL